MKVTFFSNFLNHHQTPFCEEMIKILGDDFTFVSTQETPDSFIKSGYPDCRNYSYNLLSYINNQNYNKALKLGEESEVVIIGSSPEIFIKNRLSSNKLTFRYSERLLKKGFIRLLDLKFIWNLYDKHIRNRDKNVYMLCASAFTSKDLNLVRAYPNKKLKWGYFTKVEKLDLNRLMEEKKSETIRMLWVGRFIYWKHPELVVKLAKELKEKGYDFKIDIVGSGNKKQSILNLIQKFNVSDVITLVGSLPNESVRKMMKKTDIFIFTSDRNEGWGAVLNEAMSCGCTPVVSDKIGSAPYLVKNNENGFMYKCGSMKDLVEKVELLLNDENLRIKMGKNAYLTMFEKWNPANAAKNFISIIHKINNGECFLIEDGPCSRA